MTSDQWCLPSTSLTAGGTASGKIKRLKLLVQLRPAAEAGPVG
jgi:hypothetical protein